MSAGAITSISSPYSTKPDTARASHFLVRFDEMASPSQGNSAADDHSNYTFQHHRLEKSKQQEDTYLAS